MKSILLFVDQSNKMDGRLQSALDLARAHDGHITLVQVTPHVGTVALDPLGGAFAATNIAETVMKEAQATRERLTEILSDEDVPWDVTEYNGNLIESLVSASRLSDIIILPLYNDANKGQHDRMVGDVAVSARCPVLAIPDDVATLNSNGRIAVGWNGSHEAANALRAAVPMLRLASDVDIVTIEEKNLKFPSTDALEYLSRHGVKAELHQFSRNGLTIEETLEGAIEELNADIFVLGAYGHSRLREMLLGGVTKYFIDGAKIPMLFAH